MAVALEPDAVLAGKLRLLRPLGQGGMGVVWAARHLALETEVAVKFIRPERAAADPALVARFEREARATARISHPHVVQVMDYGAVDDAVPYIVMELLHGFSLAELIEGGGRLSFATAKSLVQQVGSALGSAHERGVVHRDIKPHNVFILRESKGYPLFVKVLDFGVAKMISDTQVPGATHTLTETGMVIGSPPYMSPEQLEGSKDVDLRSDLWSLAIILYEALTGVQPFRGVSFVSVGAAVLKGKYRPASALRSNLPLSIDDWFAKALSLDPADRFPTAADMIDAFLALDTPLSDGEVPPHDARPSAFATTVNASLPPEGLTASSPAPAPRTELAIHIPDHGPDHTPGHAPTLLPDRAPGHVPALLPGRTDLLTGGSTASHAPAAKKPAPPRRRLLLLAAAACVALLAGVAGVRGLRLLAPGRPATGCPPGTALIAGATFQMGSAADAETPSDETPLHSVTVPSFCLDVTEVTVAAHAACSTCERPLLTVEFEGLTPNGRTFESQFCNGPSLRDHPINCVDWHQAKAYCAAQDKRLPTEAEWELAARGKDARTYPWGPLPPSRDRLNACGAECSRLLTDRREKVGKGPWPAMYAEDDAAPLTSPVGRYAAGATPTGVLDLAGNVWEWTSSPYCPYGNDACGDSRRVLRGGGWDTTESQDVRAARRYPSAPTARGRSIGFRCARNL